MNQPRTSPITRAPLSVCQAGGMGHILNWGVRKRSEPFTGGACFPELSCCLLTTCQAQPHSAHWENRPSLEGKGLQDSAIQGSEGLTTITWPPIPKRAGQKLHTQCDTFLSYTSKHSLRPRQFTFIHIPLTTLGCVFFKDRDYLPWSLLNLQCLAHRRCVQYTNIKGMNKQIHTQTTKKIKTNEHLQTAQKLLQTQHRTKMHPGGYSW